MLARFWKADILSFAKIDLHVTKTTLAPIHMQISEKLNDTDLM